MKDFLYAPATKENFSLLEGTIDLCLTMHNQSWYIPYGFMAYSSLNIDVNNICGSVEFKSLQDGSIVTPCLRE